MANGDRTRKLLVRSALVTSSTIATLIGAQNLALLDTRQNEPILTPTTEPTAAPPPESTPEAEAVVPAAPTLEIIHAAPSVTILRRAGQTGAIQPVSVRPASIQPPNPVQLAAPAPVIVQGEAPPPVIIQQSSGSSSGGGSSSSSRSRTQSSR
ncbi:MAG: hypothetical protein K8J31_26995 [Anaerolineae bacterium]|nr:hypothetical protein [Anaerolineae bacterium]